MEPREYDSARFVYVPPRSVAEALKEADEAASFRNAGKTALIDEYLNGPRMLGNDRLSYLVVGCTQSSERDLATPAQIPKLRETEERTMDGEECQFDILICATHFLGDGMALYTLANEFFMLLGGSSPETVTGSFRTTEEIEVLLESAWERRWGGSPPVPASASLVLSPSLEAALPPATSRFWRVAGKIDHQLSQRKLIVSVSTPSDCAVRKQTFSTGWPCVPAQEEPEPEDDHFNCAILARTDQADPQEVQNQRHLHRQRALRPICFRLVSRMRSQGRRMRR